MQRVLVTGGAGYVGSVLVPKLLESGYRVRVLDSLLFNNSSPLLSQVQGSTLISHPNFEGFIKGDVRNEKDVKKAVSGMDAVIHLAALVGAPICDRYPTEAVEVNKGGTLNILGNLNSDQRILFASTGSVYGKIDEQCSEDTPPNPTSIYGSSKYEAEKAVLDSGGVAYRFATAFGLAPRLRLDLMPNDFTNQLVRGSTLDVYDPDVRRTFIHVRDMADSWIFALENFSQMSGKAYNVGNETMNMTKQQVAEMIVERVKAKTGRDVKLWVKSEAGFDPDQRDYEVNYSKIKGVGKGFSPQVSMQQGIDELIDVLPHVNIPNPFRNA